MTVHQEDVDFLAHFGVKGMKWGVRSEKPKVTRAQRVEGRQAVQKLSGDARTAINMHRNAKTPEERAAAQAMYKRDVVNKLRTKDFQEKYQAANTLGKGEALAQVIAFNVLSPVTLGVTLAGQRRARKSGIQTEQRISREILKEMRSQN